MRIKPGLAAALAGAAIILTGCRDPGPDGTTVRGLYGLESIDGQPLPLRLSGPGPEGAFVTIHGGRIRLVLGEDEGPEAGPPRLRLETVAEIVRLDADGDER